MTGIRAIGRDIVCRPDGSIDFDFYRARAIALRRQAIQETAKLKPVRAIALTLVGVFAIILLLAHPIGAPDGHIAASGNTARVR